MNLKSWYQDNIFYKQVELRFYDCDPKKRPKVSTLMKLVADLAGVDYTNKGFGHQTLWDDGMVFLLSRMSFKLHKLPSSDDVLTVSTWEVGTKGVLFLRNFEILSETNELLISAKTAWVLVNPETRRPLRPSTFKKEMPQKLDKEIDCPNTDKICVTQPLIMVGEKVITYSELDGNGHVYNANYGNFAVDVMPLSVAEREITSFQINFISEAKLGQSIELYTAQQENQITVIGKKGQELCFEADFHIKEEPNSTV